MKKFRILFLVIVTIIGSSCTRTVYLTIEAIDVFGNPLPDVTFSIKYVEHNEGGNPVLEGSTDASGKYKRTVRFIRNKAYKINFSHKTKTFPQGYKYFNANTRSQTIKLQSSN